MKRVSWILATFVLAAVLLTLFWAIQPEIRLALETYLGQARSKDPGIVRTSIPALRAASMKGFSLPSALSKQTIVGTIFTVGSERAQLIKLVSIPP